MEGWDPTKFAVAHTGSPEHIATLVSLPCLCDLNLQLEGLCKPCSEDSIC